MEYMNVFMHRRLTFYEVWNCENWRKPQAQKHKISLRAFRIKYVVLWVFFFISYINGYYFFFLHEQRISIALSRDEVDENKNE